MKKPLQELTVQYVLFKYIFSIIMDSLTITGVIS